MMEKLPLYTLKMNLIFNENKIRDLLIALSDAVNGMEQKVVKTKTRIYKHRKYFTIVVKVKFEDGTKMKFKNKYDLDVEAELVALTEKEIAEAYGKQMTPEPKQENKIGFKLD